MAEGGRNRLAARWQAAPPGTHHTAPLSLHHTHLAGGLAVDGGVVDIRVLQEWGGWNELGRRQCM